MSNIHAVYLNFDDIFVVILRSACMHVLFFFYFSVFAPNLCFHCTELFFSTWTSFVDFIRETWKNCGALKFNSFFGFYRNLVVILLPCGSSNEFSISYRIRWRLSCCFFSCCAIKISFYQSQLSSGLALETCVLISLAYL